MYIRVYLGSMFIYMYTLKSKVIVVHKARLCTLVKCLLKREKYLGIQPLVEKYLVCRELF